MITGDCLEVLAELPAGCVDLVFADPPFNIGYEYDVYDDAARRPTTSRGPSKWLARRRRACSSPTGSFYLAIGDEYAAEHKVRLDELGLTLRNWIVWHYTFGVNCTKKFNRSHAHIFYYVRDPKHFTFNPDAVRVPSARKTTYADRRANPVGKLPDDTWVLRPQESDDSLPDAIRTPGTCRACAARSRSGPSHPCQMPEAVLERIIRVASNPGDLVLDPFAGSGTTLAVAKKLGRRFLGCELSEEYADGVRKRLKKIEVAARKTSVPASRNRQKLAAGRPAG